MNRHEEAAQPRNIRLSSCQSARLVEILDETIRRIDNGPSVDSLRVLHQRLDESGQPGGQPSESEQTALSPPEVFDVVQALVEKLDEQDWTDDDEQVFCELVDKLDMSIFRTSPSDASVHADSPRGQYAAHELTAVG